MRRLFFIFVSVLKGAQGKLGVLSPREGVWGRKWGEKSPCRGTRLGDGVRGIVDCAISMSAVGPVKVC